MRHFGTTSLHRPDRSALRGRGVWLPALAVLAVLQGCAPQTDSAPTTRASSTALVLPELGDIAAWSMAAAARPAVHPNSQMAQDFIELSFQLESGRALPVLTRFEGPVRVGLSGAVPLRAPQELAGLLARLRSDAGIEIAQGQATGANITVEYVPRAQMLTEVPNAACFVVPNVSGWADYRRLRHQPETDWAQLTTRTHVTVFIPSDIAPQEQRDCLHEELAQALGPLNDLYRLSDSVFNDDNFQSVLTKYDFAILAAYYAPELHSGMSEAAVAARLPAVLARVNPAGGPVSGARPQTTTPRSFVAALERALASGATTAVRRGAAREAVAIATNAQWNDNRTAFAWFALGRLGANSDPAAALAAFSRAALLYRATPGAIVQAAHVDMQFAALALAAGQYREALALVDRALAPAKGAENAALVATLLLIRAEALAAAGNSAAARAARLDSAPWAVYGFGSQAAADHRAAEVASIASVGNRAN